MTPAAPYTPIFDWGAPRSRKVSLAAFIAASAVGHALCFYIFQIIYPPTVALLPPPARVNLITGNTEEGRLLWRWIEAEDPALSSMTQRPADAGFSLPPDPTHVPSYSGYRPALKQLPSTQPDLRIPSSQPPGPVHFSSPLAAPSPAAVVASTVKFAAKANLPGAPEIPSFKFSASASEPPADAQFRVAVSTRGTVQHCFLEHSSGDPALDEQARQVLLLSRFPEIELNPNQQDALIWTTATIEWGSDLIFPATTSTEPSSP